jgi:hypothetical protein
LYHHDLISGQSLRLCFYASREQTTMSPPSDPIEVSSDAIEESPTAKKIREDQERWGNGSERALRAESETSARFLARPESAGNLAEGFTLGKARTPHTLRQNTPVPANPPFSFAPQSMVNHSRKTTSKILAASVCSTPPAILDRSRGPPQDIISNSVDEGNYEDQYGTRHPLEHQL